MKGLKYIAILLTWIFIGCQNIALDYEVISKSKLVEKGECKAYINYPQIIAKLDTACLNRINEMLEEFPEYEYYTQNCTNDAPQVVSGKFKLLLKTDSTLGIEYQTDIQYKNEHRKIFHSLTLNLTESALANFEFIETEPKNFIPNFDRSKVLPYLKRYNVGNNKSINLLAYQKKSNYLITWGITETHFIVYPGGEGEGFGHDKIEIPLKELK